ncbi:MAG TPA: hypothetical protein DIT25_02840 [Candidatus Moranbacteria bacterium]|nr:hypothetical protein [Candidatus Moranbacteria bacterium]
MSRLLFIRTIHFVISIIFIFCIGIIFYYGIEDKFDRTVYVASAILFFEAVALILNRGRCPLEHVHKRVNDKEEFFGHFFPEHILPYIIPFFALLSIAGFLTLYF